MRDDFGEMLKERDVVEHHRELQPENRGWKAHHFVIDAQIKYYMRANKAVMK